MYDKLHIFIEILPSNSIPLPFAALFVDAVVFEACDVGVSAAGCLELGPAVTSTSAGTWPVETICGNRYNRLTIHYCWESV